MLVLSINKILDRCQITTGWGRYTCPIKEVGGQLFFHFKGKWHKVMDYISENTDEMVRINGKNIIRPFGKK